MVVGRTKVLKRMINDGCTLDITGNLEKTVVETVVTVVDPNENVDLVNRLMVTSKSLLTEDLVKEVLSGFTTVTYKDLNRIKGFSQRKNGTYHVNIFRNDHQETFGKN